MIPRECKRLAEVDFPIREVSKHAAREKSIRHGHPSTLHLWWARRPLASCRAILLALLLPDPADAHCPPEFLTAARQILDRLPDLPNVKPGNEELRKSLLRFIAEYADWDNSAVPRWVETGRALVQAANPEESPLVVDPFAGGGSIPLEALRLGCEAFASDLNPVACLILKVMLEDIPRHGPTLAEELRRVGGEIKREAEKELADLYPRDSDGATPITYLWARTVRCESPNCGAEIPLMRSFWLCKKANRRLALRSRVERPVEGPPRVAFAIFEPKAEWEVLGGTVARAKATCVCCGAVLPPDRVRAQLAANRGGADVVFDGKGQRIGGALLLAVVSLRTGEMGRHYRLSTVSDYEAVHKSQVRVAKLLENWKRDGSKGPCPVPDEPLPLMSGTFNVPLYGMTRWGDLYSARQKASLESLALLLQRHKSLTPEIVALSIGRMADFLVSGARWKADAECPVQALSRQAIPMVWDFAEVNPWTEATGSLTSQLDRMAAAIDSVSFECSSSAQVQLVDAPSHPLPDNTTHVWFTDPPYYFAVPYADLSDFFFVWLKRTLPDHSLLRDPFDSSNPLTPKGPEICEMRHWDRDRYAEKDQAFFEEGMRRAFAEGHRVLREDGVGSVVFAHKTTEGWEALLSGMIRGGWTITGSWPIATEMGSRLRARDSAALATSVHLICRPRKEDAGLGEWSTVLAELPVRVADWMDRLEESGVHGADLVFACIGPALEIFSRYVKVVDAADLEIPLGGNAEATDPHLRGYLAYVWETVARAALERVLGGPEAKARNGAAGALEEDARLTALFLWTLKSTNGEEVHTSKETDEPEPEEEDDEDEEGGSSRAKKPRGFNLPYDVARRFAQPLGIHLDDWKGRIIDIDKGVVRLLPVVERSQQLLGEDVEAFATELQSDPSRAAQLSMFEEDLPPAVRGRRKARESPADLRAPKPRTEATTLDRVHAAMLLQKSGQASALRTLLQTELQRGPDFLRLANALSALYPKSSEEKRLVDAMLLAVPK